MGMLVALRTYKKEDKIVALRIVDTLTLQCKDYEIKDPEFNELLKSSKIENVLRDNYGRVKLKNYNPKVRDKAYKIDYIYSNNYKAELKIQYYCMIIDKNNSGINTGKGPSIIQPNRNKLGSVNNGLWFIADTTSRGIVTGDIQSIASLSIALDTPIDQIKIYNAYIEKQSKAYLRSGKASLDDRNTGYTMYLYKPEKESYQKIQYNTTIKDKTDDLDNVNSRLKNKVKGNKIDLGNGWTTDDTQVDNSGIYVSGLKYKEKQSLLNINNSGKLGYKQPGTGKGTGTNTNDSIKNIPDGIYNIEYYRGGAKNICTPVTLTKLGESCFKGINDLETIDLRKSTGLKEISNSCFENCTKLKDIRFSGKEQVIGKYAFKGCKSLRGAIVTSAEEIGTGAFMNSVITTIKMLGAQELYQSTFENCYSLKNITLNEGLLLIGIYCFKNCGRLESIEIPSTVTDIRPGAFMGCVSLKNIILHRENADKLLSVQGAIPRTSSTKIRVI